MSMSNLLNIAPRVHIIILNYNTWRDTLQCLATIRELNYANYEVVVVDNDSKDESAQRIQGAFPHYTFIQTGANLGYAGGNNVGIRYALDHNTDYVWILNPDTFVDKEALGELIKAAAQSQAGIVGSKVYYASPPNVLWFAGGKINWRKGHVYGLGADEVDTGQYDANIETMHVVGTSMLISRQILEQTQGFDESYFLYLEESDLCARAAKAGCVIVFAPQSRIWHKETRSAGKGSNTVLYYYIRNNIRYMKAHGSTAQYIGSLPYIAKRGYRLLVSEDRSNLMKPRRWRVLLRALFDGLRGRGGKWEQLHAH